MARADGTGVDGDVDIEDYLEQELLRSPTNLTSHLFHYTNANAAISGVLRSGEFRLAPFDGTNDLWESRPLYPTMSMHADHQGSGPDVRLWEEIDKHLRRHAKVGCFTQDWQLPDNVFDSKARRGWGHLSLWAHYGDRHAGVCLRFDRERLVAALEQSTDSAAYRFQGPVRYGRASIGLTHPIDLGQIDEFGVDAASLAFAVLNQDTVFFRKHADWASESEFRLVLLGSSVAPAYVDIREALSGVVLGEVFPDYRMPELRAELERYPDVELFKLGYLNRRLFCTPLTDTTDPPPERREPAMPAPRQPGDVHQRVANLLAAVEESEALRTASAALVEEHRSQIEKVMSEMLADIATWDKIDVRVHQSIAAVPEGLRARAPGVAGESVYFQYGLMCVGENLPMNSHTFVAAAAIQVLAGGVFRLHGVVSTERWDPNGNSTTEHWREQRKAQGNETDGELRELLVELRAAVLRTRSEFDEQRLR